MAESISKLMIKLGLDVNDLDGDFLKVSESLKSNMDRLKGANTLIRLQTAIDLKGVTNDAERLRILQNSLTRQIENQNAKVKAATMAWQDAIRRTNEYSKSTQDAAIALKSEELALVNLQQRLKEVADQQKALPKADNSLLAGYKGLKGNISNIYSGSIGELVNKFNELSTASQSADGAITKSLEIIGSIPHPVGRAVAAIASMPLVFKGVENSIIETAKAAAAAGDSVYVMSRGFQMSVADTAKFTTNCKVAGVEVSDLSSTVKRLQQQVLKAGDSGNAVTKMLQRYGVSIYDTNGHLKNLNDMTMALSQGLKRAQAEGNGAAFVLTAFRNASGDAITAIEDWADVNEQAAKIVKNGLSDPKLAHNLQGNINAMNQQAAQLNASFASVLLPVANEIVPRVTDRMADLTKFLADNKEEIKSFGVALGDFFGKVEDIADMTFSAVGKTVSALKELKIDPKQRELEKSLSFNLNPNMAFYNQTLAYYNPMFKALGEVRVNTEKAVKEIKNEIDKTETFSAGGGISAQLERDLNTDVFDAKIENLRKVRLLDREAKNILYKIDHDSYENRRRDLEDWWKNQTETQVKSQEESAAYEKLYHAKLQQLEKEHQDEIARQRESTSNKIKEITQETSDIEFSLTHTAFEKQLRDIEQWKEAQLSKREYAEYTAEIIANAAAKEAEAFEREVERIKGLTQSLEDEIFAMENSQYEVDKRSAIQKAQQELDKGVDSATVGYWLQKKMEQLDKKAAKGGDYVESPTGGGSGPKYIDFDKPAQPSIGLFADTDKIMARLKSSATQQVKDVQSLMAQTAESDIEIIRGLRSNLKSAGNFAPQVISQTQLPMEQFQNAIATTLARQMQTQPAPITVSPTINISLEGNVVADQQWIDDTAEKIKDEVCNGITSAVESATKNNYSYAN